MCNLYTCRTGDQDCTLLQLQGSSSTSSTTAATPCKNRSTAWEFPEFLICFCSRCKMANEKCPHLYDLFPYSLQNPCMYFIQSSLSKYHTSTPTIKKSVIFLNTIILLTFNVYNIYCLILEAPSSLMQPNANHLFCNSASKCKFPCFNLTGNLK